MNSISNLRIPDEADWSGFEDDFDVRNMHKLFFGKSVDEVLQHFDGAAIQRCTEFLYASRPVFQYYIHGFVLFLKSKSAEGDSDAASPFLGLLEGREQKDPGSVSDIYSSLSDCVDYVANNQAYFDADLDIYGDFKVSAARIRKLCCNYAAKFAQSSSVASRPINTPTACLALSVPSSTFTTHCVIGISTPSDSARWLTVRAQ